MTAAPATWKTRKAGLFWGQLEPFPLRALFCEQRYRIRGAIVFETQTDPRQHPNWWAEFGHASVAEVEVALRAKLGFHPRPVPGSRANRALPHQVLREMLVALDVYLEAGGLARPRGSWFKENP